MNCDFLKNLKAALLCAAFLMCFLSSNCVAQEGDLDSVKQKATDLLLQKKKTQALQLILAHLKTEHSTLKKEEALEFLVKISQKFISREAQEAYENSINLTLENAKQAASSNERCLALEPQHIECLIQKARLQAREKNNRAFLETRNKIRELAPHSKFDFWLEILGQKNDTEFRNRQTIKLLPEKVVEENIGLLLLELDRSFLAKNYSRAKDLLNYFEKHYSDWPDLLFYKYRINLESTEEKQRVGADGSSEQLMLYANKCKSLSKTTARKYRYDFDLCIRTI